MENNIELLKNEPLKTQNLVRYYANKGKLELIKTDNGLAYNKEELNNARLNKENIKKEFTNITNADLLVNPFICTHNNGKVDANLLRDIKKYNCKRYFNTDTKKMYYNTIETLYKETNKIAERLGLSQSKVEKALLNLFKTTKGE